MTAWQNQGMFAFGLMSVVAIGATYVAVRSGVVNLRIRVFNVSIRRDAAPVRYWSMIFLYAVVAITLLISAISNVI